MKYLILATSFFYLLGVKMTQHIEAGQKAGNDSIEINISQKNAPANLNSPGASKLINLPITSSPKAVNPKNISSSIEESNSSKKD